ncbi:MAG: arginine deiminase family protein, partial [Candidatus Microthrix parvicella]
MSYRVDSEVGQLRQAIIHRPDLELKRLTPTNKDDLLFDEILWVKRARQEHDAFADALREAGVTVHHFDELLRQTLALPEAKKHILDGVLDERVYGPMAIDPLRNLFEGMEQDDLATHLIGGISKREILDRIDG